jgi:hypothetical protein
VTSWLITVITSHIITQITRLLRNAYVGYGPPQWCDY